MAIDEWLEDLLEAYAYTVYETVWYLRSDRMECSIHVPAQGRGSWTARSSLVRYAVRFEHHRGHLEVMLSMGNHCRAPITTCSTTTTDTTIAIACT
eukprot:1097570-Pyramimonas_sp.AAC.1